MNTKKRWIIGILAAVLLAAGLAGGWHLYDTYVDRSGWELKDGAYYYRDFHNKRVSGWQTLEEKRYYFGADNAMVTHWQEIDGSRYYFGRDGALDIGWLEIEGSRYHTTPEGIIQTGWQDIEFQRYYFGDDGILRTGWLQLDGSTFYLGADGAAALGLTRIDGDTYHFSEIGVMHTGELELDGSILLFGEDGVMHTGWWQDGETRRYYFPETGAMALQWQTLEDKLYYFGEDGVMHTGWLQLGENRYYLHADGTAAVGKQEIDGETHYFSPMGIHVVLVNTQHKVPKWYEVNLVTLTGYHVVSDVCLEPLQRMLADCKAAGNNYNFNSAYRSVSQQQQILTLRTQEYEAIGYDSGDAYWKARETVALPGTSEHHLGLAVDILGDDAIAWLHENCWEYGFILRYTAEKSHITGFVDEPWHFRYVGKEVAQDMKDSGLCLEEYLGAV